MPQIQSYDPNCPVCGQGGLEPVYLTPFADRPFWICSECDALWQQAEPPTVRHCSAVQRLGSLLEAHGHPDSWEYVTGVTQYVFEGKVMYQSAHHGVDVAVPNARMPTAPERRMRAPLDVLKSDRRRCVKCATEQLHLLTRDAESVVCWECTACGAQEGAGHCCGMARHERIPKLGREFFRCDECDRIWPTLDDLLSPTYSEYLLLDEFLAANGLSDPVADVESIGRTLHPDWRIPELPDGPTRREANMALTLRAVFFCLFGSALYAGVVAAFVQGAFWRTFLLAAAGSIPLAFWFATMKRQHVILIALGFFALSVFRAPAAEAAVPGALEVLALVILLCAYRASRLLCQRTPPRPGELEMEKALINVLRRQEQERKQSR